MSKENKFLEYTNDPEFFELMKAEIDKELSNLKKIVDNVNQMRVDTCLLEKDLLTVLNADSWEKVATLIGHGPHCMAYIKTEK